VAVADPAGKVLVVDDDDSIRRALVRLLRSAGLAAEPLADAESVLERLPLDGVGCLVLDLQLGGLSGLELQERLDAAGCKLPIVFLTGRGDIPTSVRAMRLGAVDFIEKPADADVLLGAVRSALARQAERVADGWRKQQWLGEAQALTPREHEVLRWIISGAPNKLTAQRLGIAEKTVKVHRSRILEKMGSRSLAELVRVCEAIGIPPAELEPPCADRRRHKVQ
jgi:FixJ family two-component response regulator